jgi:hypothetical protein
MRLILYLGMRVCSDYAINLTKIFATRHRACARLCAFPARLRLRHCFESGWGFHTEPNLCCVSAVQS